MAVLRHLALNLLKRDTSVKVGIAAKRKDGGLGQRLPAQRDLCVKIPYAIALGHPSKFLPGAAHDDMMGQSFEYLRGVFMWLPKSIQRVVFWVIDFVGVAVIAFVPFYLLRYGTGAIMSQAFGEGVMVEVIGAVGTAVLLLNISIFARNAGVVADADQEQLDQLQQELHEVKQELAEMKTLLQPRKRPFLLRLFFGK